MNRTLASQRLLEGAWPDDVQIISGSSGCKLVLERSLMRITITIALGVREWFVEVLDPRSDSRIQDWCDYDGYDETPVEQRDVAMAQDVSAFAATFVSRELRMGHGNKVLEWKVEEQWRVAVPFASDSLRVSTDPFSHQTLR